MAHMSIPCDRKLSLVTHDDHTPSDVLNITGRGRGPWSEKACWKPLVGKNATVLPQVFILQFELQMALQKQQKT